MSRRWLSLQLLTYSTLISERSVWCQVDLMRVFYLEELFEREQRPSELWTLRVVQLLWNRKQSSLIQSVAPQWLRRLLCFVALLAWTKPGGGSRPGTGIQKGMKAFPVSLFVPGHDGRERLHTSSRTVLMSTSGRGPVGTEPAVPSLSCMSCY